MHPDWVEYALRGIIDPQNQACASKCPAGYYYNRIIEETSAKEELLYNEEKNKLLINN